MRTPSETPVDIVQAAKPPPPHLRVFVNRNLRMDTICAIGFDMDYTLARYRREHLEELAYKLTIDKLVERGYPEEIRRAQYDPNFVIRGLVVDKKLGNIIKLDRHHHPARVYHGRRRVTKTARRRMYRREKLNFVPPRFALVDTLFSLPEMCLYADLIDLFELDLKRSVDTWQLFDDTRECIDLAHRDGTLKSLVVRDLGRYVEKDQLLARTLHKLRSAGKKLFLLTNSYWPYTDALMTFLLRGEMGEYPNWRNFFEAVIVGCRKPSFFTSDEPFLEIANDESPIRKAPPRIERGKIYQGGNLQALESALGYSGEEILYVGDHIYGDILSSKKASLWRTALVVEELESEMQLSEEFKDLVQRTALLDIERRHLDDGINSLRHALSILDKTRKDDGGESARTREVRLERDRAKRKMKRIIRDIDELEGRLDQAFNPYWGLVFKEGRENSRFGEQMADYACLYTSRVSNFLGYSAYQYFRSPWDLLPHEREP